MLADGTWDSINLVVFVAVSTMGSYQKYREATEK